MGNGGQPPAFPDITSTLHHFSSPVLITIRPETGEGRQATGLRSPNQRQALRSSGRQGLLKVLRDSRNTTRSVCSAAVSLSGFSLPPSARDRSVAASE